MSRPLTSSTTAPALSPTAGLKPPAIDCWRHPSLQFKRLCLSQLVEPAGACTRSGGPQPSPCFTPRQPQRRLTLPRDLCLPPRPPPPSSLSRAPAILKESLHITAVISIRRGSSFTPRAPDLSRMSAPLCLHHIGPGWSRTCCLRQFGALSPASSRTPHFQAFHHAR